MKLKNDRLLRAIRREPLDVTPIWMMRQAGRYLPEYRKLREKAGSFLNLCKNSDLACEVTLQPLKRFDLDAAILFSDILTIPDAMGLGLYFVEGEGPCFEQKIETIRDIKHLTPPDPELSLKYVLDTVRLIKHELGQNLPLIGFCGSPWTLGCYMIEGRSKPFFPRIMKLAEEDPSSLHHLLEKLADAVTLHLNAQIKAGVDVVMIFDTWGGLLDPVNYSHFSLNYIKNITENLIKKIDNHSIPSILFAKNQSQNLELLSTSGVQVIGLDHSVNLKHARAAIGQKVALQGNLDPTMLLASPEEMSAHVAKILEDFGEGSGHIFNLGHGVLPTTSPDHVAHLVNEVHQLSQKYHSHASTI